MNNADLTKTRQALVGLRNHDLTNLFRQSWPTGDLNESLVGDLPSPQFEASFTRFLNCFERALDDDGHLLPRTVVSGIPSIGSIDLTADLENLNSYLAQRNWAQVWTLFRRLLFVLMTFGYWSKGTRNAHVAVQAKAESLLAETKNKLTELTATLESLRQEESGLRELLASRKSELTQIPGELTSARSDRDSINDLLVKATETKGKIDDLFSKQESRLVEIKTDQDDMAQKQVELDGKLAEAAKLVAKTKTDADWIDGKREEIRKLTGQAADGSLGHSFNSRKGDIVKALGFWKQASLWASGIVIVYVIIAYFLVPMCIQQPTDALMALVSNVGKMIPVLLVYGFILRQYSRERSFLEEYEFKAAVAFVVNAYADQLAPPKLDPDDFEDHKALQDYLRAKEDERRKLIADTVSKLFTPPHIHTERSPGVFAAFRPKTMVDMVRETKDLIKTAKAD